MANPTTVTWVDPTENIDGTPIAAGEITGYTVGIRNTATAGSTAGTYPITVAAPAGATSILLSAVTPPLVGGSYALSVQATTAQGPSAWATETTFTIVEVPKAPTGLKVS
jgi:hypothetical protein